MTRKVNRIFKYSIVLTLLTAAWWLLAAGGKPRAAVSFLQNLKRQTVISETKTSTGFRNEREFQKTLNCYSGFQEVYREEYSTPVPGLMATNVMGTICSQMVPQGICIAGDFMLVTAYDNANVYSGKAGDVPASRSVLYVLSNQTPENRILLTTIVLPDVNHVGGVAFDGKRVWIAKSTTRRCSVIDYDIIKQAAEQGKKNYVLERYSQNVYCGAVASFLTWHEGCLWVGTYSNRIDKKGALRSYKVIEGDRLELVKQSEIIIPGSANGVSFLEHGDETYMAVSTSQGRYFDSEIYFYQVEKDIRQDRNLYYCYNSCKFPPMAEELVCDGENTYFLFESAAACYSAGTYLSCGYPVDRICALSTFELFWQNHGMAYDNMTRGGMTHRIPMAENVAFHEDRQYWRRYV